MIKQPRIPLFDLILCLSKIIDLISSDLTNHHKRVAYMSYFIAEAYGLPQDERNKILLAGLMHDCGALSLRDKMGPLEFEFGFTPKDRYKHCYLGFKFLSNVKMLSNIAPLIRNHHTYWNEKDNPSVAYDIPIGCHILHLADRVDVLLQDKQNDILLHANEIFETILKESGRMFCPELVHIFIQLAKQECFLLDMVSPFIDTVLSRKVDSKIVDLDLDGLEEVSKLFYQLIDFRSRYTATHSASVTACAVAIFKRLGFSETECRMIGIAGYLHDLGKLAIPSEILEKAGALCDDEMSRMKRHTYYSYRILESIQGLETINQWAFFHHERLDGSGYPFHLEAHELSLGSRVLAVADVFAALTEDRPYRKALNRDDSISILQQNAQAKKLDPAIVSMIKINYDDIFSEMHSTKLNVVMDYESFCRDRTGQ